MRTTPAVGPAFWSPRQLRRPVARRRERPHAQNLKIHVADVQRIVGLRAQACRVRSAFARAPPGHAGAEGIALRVVARLAAGGAAVTVAAHAEIALGPLSRRGGMRGAKGDQGGGKGVSHRTPGWSTARAKLPALRRGLRAARSATGPQL